MGIQRGFRFVEEDLKPFHGRFETVRDVSEGFRGPWPPEYFLNPFETSRNAAESP